MLCRWQRVLLPFILFATAACAGQPQTRPSVQPDDARAVILATTTSTRDSGLLDVLVPIFERDPGYVVKTISVGTGAALAMGARGESDVLLVHAPEAEQRWMAQGYGAERLRVMHNDFVIVGPPADPAHVRSTGSAIDALRRIRQTESLWISRDDGSGTDQLEKRLWREFGDQPVGSAWYVTSGQGMGATLTLADQKDGYTLTDRATYLAQKERLALSIVREGDPRLLNVYHVMTARRDRFPDVAINERGGTAFAHFLVSPETQRIIGDFGRERHGQALFVADAATGELRAMD